jgi:hypothetical protein
MFLRGEISILVPAVFFGNCGYTYRAGCIYYFNSIVRNYINYFYINIILNWYIRYVWTYVTLVETYITERIYVLNKY